MAIGQQDRSGVALGAAASASSTGGRDQLVDLRRDEVFARPGRAVRLAPRRGAIADSWERKYLSDSHHVPSHAGG